MEEFEDFFSALEEVNKTVNGNRFQIQENAFYGELKGLKYEVKKMSRKLQEISSRFTGRMQAD